MDKRFFARLSQALLHLNENNRQHHDISIYLNNIMHDLTNLSELEDNSPDAENILETNGNHCNQWQPM